jgi:hypothetical protein
MTFEEKLSGLLLPVTTLTKIANKYGFESVIYSWDIRSISDITLKMGG